MLDTQPPLATKDELKAVLEGLPIISLAVEYNRLRRALATIKKMKLANPSLDKWQVRFLLLTNILPSTYATLALLWPFAFIVLYHSLLALFFWASLGFALAYVSIPLLSLRATRLQAPNPEHLILLQARYMLIYISHTGLALLFIVLFLR